MHPATSKIRVTVTILMDVVVFIVFYLLDIDYIFAICFVSLAYKHIIQYLRNLVVRLTLQILTVL